MGVLNNQDLKPTEVLQSQRQYFVWHLEQERRCSSLSAHGKDSSVISIPLLAKLQMFNPTTRRGKEYYSLANVCKHITVYTVNKMYLCNLKHLPEIRNYFLSILNFLGLFLLVEIIDNVLHVVMAIVPLWVCFESICLLSQSLCWFSLSCLWEKELHFSRLVKMINY